MHVSTTCFIHHAAYFIPHVHVPTITCLLLRTLYASHVHYAVGSLPLANNGMHSPSWRAGASQPKNCRGSETAEARERRDLRKRRLDSESADEKETRLSVFADDEKLSRL